MEFEEKIENIKELFKDFWTIFECFPSPTKNYRVRAEFGIFHHSENIDYAMFEQKSKRKIIVKNPEFCDKKICTLMPLLLQKLNANLNLKQKLFGVEFLATKSDFSTTLLYHKDITLIQEDLEKLSRELDLNLIARSKGKKQVFGKENLRQSLNIHGKDFFYELNNDCFVQPNTFINEKIIEWILKLLEKQERKALLELYCGYGNFTLPLSKYFEKVLATELSKTNIHFALKNCELNQSSNITFVRMSSEDLSKAFKKEREFYRLKNTDLDSFDFSHVLVDPPRSGLDRSVIKLIENYDNIFYVSCNPLSLKEDLKILTQTHKIMHFALFDQFVKTPHLECGVMLKKEQKYNS